MPRANPSSRRAILAPTLLLFIAPLAGQVAPSPSVEPALLAKYDRNNNGRLDADEVAALQADQAKAARAVATDAGTGAKEEVVQLSPFEVNAGEDKGYAASNSLAGTRLNSRLEDIAERHDVIVAFEELQARGEHVERQRVLGVARRKSRVAAREHAMEVDHGEPIAVAPAVPRIEGSRDIQPALRPRPPRVSHADC